MKQPTNFLLLAFLIVCLFSFWYARSCMPDKVKPTTVRDEELKEVPVESSNRPGSESITTWHEPENESLVHLVILNGTDIPGLARDISLALAMSGCVTQRLGNAPHTHYQHSLLVNRRLSSQRVNDLADRLGGLIVTEEWDSRTTEDALLVLGADYQRIRRALGLSSELERKTQSN